MKKDDNVVKFYPSNAAENPDNVLEQAMGVYQDVVIVGWDKDGNFDARASSKITQAELYWLISILKRKLINGEYNNDEY